MPDPDPSNPNKKEKKVEQIKLGVMKALESSNRFTPEEQEEIASTIESEIARLLPELPKGITEIAFKAIGLSLDVADKLLDQQEHSPVDDQSDS